MTGQASLRQLFEVEDLEGEPSKRLASLGRFRGGLEFLIAQNLEDLVDPLRQLVGGRTGPGPWRRQNGEGEPDHERSAAPRVH